MCKLKNDANIKTNYNVLYIKSYKPENLVQLFDKTKIFLLNDCRIKRLCKRLGKLTYLSLFTFRKHFWSSRENTMPGWH